MNYKKILFCTLAFVSTTVGGTAANLNWSVENSTEFEKNPLGYIAADMKKFCEKYKFTTVKKVLKGEKSLEYSDDANEAKELFGKYKNAVETRSFYSWDFQLMTEDERCLWLTGAYDYVADLLNEYLKETTRVRKGALCVGGKGGNYTDFARDFDRILFCVRNLRGDRLPKDLMQQVNALWNATFYFRLYADHVTDEPKNTYPDPEKAPTLKDRWYMRECDLEEKLEQLNKRYTPSKKALEFRGKVENNQKNVTFNLEEEEDRENLDWQLKHMGIFKKIPKFSDAAVPPKPTKKRTQIKFERNHVLTAKKRKKQMKRSFA